MQLELCTIYWLHYMLRFNKYAGLIDINSYTNEQYLKLNKTGSKVL